MEMTKILVVEQAAAAEARALAEKHEREANLFEHEERRRQGT